MKDFPRDKIDQIKAEIDRCLKLPGVEPIAAFDADGTLWSCDMGEGLFKYQIKKKLLPHLPPDPWEYYLKWHTDAPTDAFLWLAQINESLPLATVQGWAKEAVCEMGEVPVFTAVKEIMDHLHAHKVQTFIVTASIKWAVEPAAELYGIPKERVIGISTKVVDGIVTREKGGPITWREGKVEGLMLATGGKKPFFCAGNTKGDLPLLECSSHLRLVMASAKEDEVNFKTEREMIELAKSRGWFFHSFV